MADYTSRGVQANPNRTAGSGVQIFVNGRWVDSDSAEARAVTASTAQAARNNLVKDIEAQTNMEKAKARIAINDQARDRNENLAGARVASAAGASTRGMSRRVHRRRGPSAFAAMGRLTEASRQSALADLDTYYDTVKKEKIGISDRQYGFSPLMQSSKLKKPVIK